MKPAENNGFPWANFDHLKERTFCNAGLSRMRCRLIMKARQMVALREIPVEVLVGYDEIYAFR